MNKINKFRSIIFAIMLTNRFIQLRQDGKKLYLAHSIKEFTNTYENCDNQIKNWVFNSVKVSLNSVF